MAEAPTIPVPVACWEDLREGLGRPWRHSAAWVDVQIAIQRGESRDARRLAARWGWTLDETSVYLRNMTEADRPNPGANRPADD